MTFEDFNKLDRDAAAKELFSCCGSQKWVSALMTGFPFCSEKELIAKATDAWYMACCETDWLESFAHHPKIGDEKSLHEKFAGKEQEGIAAASPAAIELLAKANVAYESKFGFIFIVCATGRSADEMLRLVNDRLVNSREEELLIGMGEQQKITVIRLKKLMPTADWSFLRVSQLTTHVLDTTLGRPGAGITIKLLSNTANGRQVIAQGVTNADGRIADLLPPERILPSGDYKMVFVTGNYFSAQNIKGFYPVVGIRFMVEDEAHYHIPLLISPYGYSTYRGS